MSRYLTTVSATRAALAEARARGLTVGLVPTMGALHDGHLSLIRRARAENGVVVVSMFVNPTQFGPSEDLERYPRPIEHDREAAQAEGADLIFAPTVLEMYTEGYSTWVEVDDLTTGLCGGSRPGHFRGVCTVVTKLLNICRPDRAYFGEKDAQQLAVVTRMARDLDLDVDIVACPTVREADGLAMSSRNTRLSAEERAEAPVLYRALVRARVLAEGGERDAAVLDYAVRAVLAEASLGRIDYVEIVSKSDLLPVPRIGGECLVAIAVWFGDTRLIDNITIAA